MPRPLTLEDLISFPHSGAGECDLSSDGKRVAYTHQGLITLFDLRQWSALTAFEGSSPKWSPADPETFAYLDPATAGICIRRLEGATQRLAEQVGTVDKQQWTINPVTFEWSQDGRFLALVVDREVKSHEDETPEQVDGGVVVRPPSFRYANALVVLEVATSRVTFQVTSDAGETYEHLAWHPSGDRLTILSVKKRVGWRLFDIDLHTGRQKNRIGPGINEIGMMKWSPDGKKLALGYSPYNYKGDVRLLCAVMEDSGEQIQILNHDYFVRAVGWDGDGRKIYADGLKGLSRHIFCVDSISGQTQVIMARTGLTDLRGVSRDGRTLLASFSGLLTLRDIYVLCLENGQSKAVTHFSDQLAEYELADAAVVEWPSDDGLMLEGVVVPPLGSAMSPSHPTIVDLHSGPVEGGAAIFFRDWHWWAGAGFQVFAPDFRGSQQYQWVQPPTQESDFKDVMSGIDWLIRQKLGAPDKMGVHGESYGAILGAYAVGKTPLFRAAALLSGRYDWRAFCGSSYGEFDRSFAQSMGGAPWEIPHVYDELSATSHVAKVETPVLILHGEEDALPQNAPALYAAYLRGAGKTVEFVLYKGEGHGLYKPSHRRDRWERTLRWFGKYLLQ